jgi:hypothetical protein
LNSRTRGVLSKKRQASGKTSEAMLPNSKKWKVQMLEKNDSSGRTRTYNPLVNSRKELTLRIICHTLRQSVSLVDYTTGITEEEFLKILLM